MLQRSRLPIVQKARLLQIGHVKALSRYHALCLSFIVPHGTTDLFVGSPKPCALSYGAATAGFMFQPTRRKFFALFLASLFHLKDDVQGPLLLQVAFSLALHCSWVWFPEFALSYLAWVHTALHYWRVRSFLRLEHLGALLLLQSFVYFLARRFETDELSFGASWVPLVLGHIASNAS